MPRILFLCTGNSCRSQMAEGFARYLGGALVNVESAGIEAHGLNPRAVAVMHEAGIDISGQQSTALDARMLERADIVVTVCGHADARCPMLPSGKHKEHWPLEDPARAAGDEAAIMATFRDTRTRIHERVAGLLARIGAGAIRVP